MLSNLQKMLKVALHFLHEVMTECKGNRRPSLILGPAFYNVMMTVAQANMYYRVPQVSINTHIYRQLFSQDKRYYHVPQFSINAHQITFSVQEVLPCLVSIPIYSPFYQAKRYYEVPQFSINTHIRPPFSGQEYL